MRKKMIIYRLLVNVLCFGGGVCFCTLFMRLFFIEPLTLDQLDFLVIVFVVVMITITCITDITLTKKIQSHLSPLRTEGITGFRAGALLLLADRLEHNLLPHSLSPKVALALMLMIATSVATNRFYSAINEKALMGISLALVMLCRLPVWLWSYFPSILIMSVPLGYHLTIMKKLDIATSPQNQSSENQN